MPLSSLFPLEDSSPPMPAPGAHPSESVTSWLQPKKNYHELSIMLATILHADLDAFYASVEQLLDPSLRGKPIAVGGGVVLAASYEAKAFGVKGGMPGRRARELCPQLIFVGGHFKEYSRLGDAAMKVLGRLHAAGRAHLDRRGLRRRRGLHASLRLAGRDRPEDPPAREERARPADLGRRGAHQAPGQDRLAGRQARRAGRGRSRDASWPSCTTCRSS